MTTEKQDNAPLALCIKFAEIPAGVWINGTVKRPCYRCGAELAVAPSTQQAAKADARLKIICYPCFNQHESGPYVPVITKTAVDELHEIENSHANN